MRLYVFLFGLVALMLVPALVFDDEIDGYFAGQEGLNRLRQFGPWAWLAGIGLIVADLVLPVPSTAVSAGLGMIYGPVVGGVVAGVGSTLAGLVAYGGCRLLGKRFVDWLVGPEAVVRLAGFFERHGTWAISLSRWMPLLPEALCCLAGMTRMRPGPFLGALATGSFAMGFAFAFLGEAYLDRPAAGLIVSALIPLVVWPPIHYLVRRPAPAA
jgi:uncharacterized membrane protein YdjX (TVP38/TMEM64 family)